MRKYILTSITSVFLIASAANADNSRLIMKSGIGLSDNNSYAQITPDTTDPVKWKDDTRLSKNPSRSDQSKSDEPKCFYVTSPVTNIRSTPSFLGDRIGIYKYGNYVCERSRMGEWINTGNGWVNIKFLSDKNPDAKTAAKPQEAKAQDTVKTVAIKRQVQPKQEQTLLTPEETAVAPRPAAPVLKKALVAKQASQKQTETKPAKEETKSNIAYINGDKVNIRKKPNKNSKIVGTYGDNQKVTILDTKSGWTKTKKGWVNSKYITEAKDKDGKKSAKKEEKIVKCMYVSYDKANIRETPSKRSKDIGDYDKGTNVCFYEVKKNWARSDKGWVSLANFSEAKCYEVIPATLKVMSKPSSSSKLLKTLKQGDQVCDYGRKYGWVNNGKGWVSGLYLK